MRYRWNRPLPQGDALEKEAERLGVSPYRARATSGYDTVLDEPELQRRVLAARADRFIALQTFAIVGALLLSAVASVANIAVNVWDEHRESEHVSADFMLKFNDEIFSGGSGRVAEKLDQDLPLSEAKDVSDEDIDDFLGNFENLATAYRHKVINLDMTDDPFTDYLAGALQDPRIQRQLVRERGEDCQYYDRVLDLARSLQISVPSSLATCSSGAQAAPK